MSIQSLQLGTRAKRQSRSAFCSSSRSRWGVVVGACVLVLFANRVPSQTIIGSLPLAGYYAGQIAVNSLTNRVYIAGSFSQPNIVIVNASVGSNPIIVGPSSPVIGVIGIGVAPLLNSFYTSQGYNGSIGTYSSVNDQIVGTTPISGCGGYLTVDSTVPGLTLVFAGSTCGSGNDLVHVMNGLSRGIVGGPLSSGGTVTGLFVSPYSGYLYVATGANTRIFSSYPPFSAVTSFGAIGAAYAAAPTSHKLYTWHLSNLRVMTELSAAGGVVISGAGGRCAAHEAAGHAYAWDGGNTVKVIGIATDSVIGTIAFAPNVAVHWVTVDAPNNRVYVTASGPLGLTTLYVLRDDGCVGGSGQPNSSAAGLLVNAVGGAGCGGPFNVGVPSGGSLTLSWSGPANAPFALAIAPTTIYSLGIGCIGILGIGTAPTFADIVVPFDGTQPGVVGALFHLDPTGRASESFTVPLPAGYNLGGLQGIVFQPSGSPCAAMLTAAFGVSVY